jgi:hypothetical protein
VKHASGFVRGGLIGDDGCGRNISGGYWHLDSSGIRKKSEGAGAPKDDPGITGLTTEQFQSGLPAGFDPGVWGENANINGGLPYLPTNPPPK